MKSFNLSYKLTCLFCLFILAYFVLMPNQAVEATINSILLWAYKVLPNIFAFGIISSVAVNMNLLSNIGCINTVLNSLKIASEGASPYAVSLICASPLSVKCVCDMYSDGRIKKEDAQHLLVLCSTLSPLFLYSSIGILMYQSTPYALSMVITNYAGVYLSAYLYSMLYNKYPHKKTSGLTSNTYQPTFFSSFTNAVTNSSVTAINIGGFLVFFGVMIYAFSDFGIIQKNSLSGGIATMLTEITAGANILKDFLANNEFLIMSISYATIGFGGCCFLTQNISFITKTNLSVKRFVLFKFFNAIINIILGNFILCLLKLMLNI